MKAVTDHDFDAEVLAGPPVLVDFWAQWCGPCRQLAPVLEALQADLGDKLTVVKLNVDENPKTAIRYGVSALPTMILFRDGEPVHQILGVRPKGALRAELDARLG
jgi:thioredoxin 1